MVNPTPGPNSNDFSELIGRLYGIWTLDCLIEIGYAVSIDFITRPQLYLGDDIPDTIVALRMSYGTDTQFPNTVQRQAIMMPIFGRSDGLMPDSSTGTAPFHVARKKLVDACIAFSERAVDTGIAMLQERVKSALVPLQAHLQALQGKSVQLSALQMDTISSTIVSILHSQEVGKVFSVSPADPNWPFNSNDSNGAKLVENASSKLALSQEYKLTYTKFILLQRVALEGEQALAKILKANLDANQELLDLISQVYSWGTSLRDYQQAA